MHEPLQVVTRPSRARSSGYDRRPTRHRSSKSSHHHACPNRRPRPPSGLRTNGQSMDLAQQSPPLAPIKSPPNPVRIGQSRRTATPASERPERVHPHPARIRARPRRMRCPDSRAARDPRVSVRAAAPRPPPARPESEPRPRPPAWWRAHPPARGGVEDADRRVEPGGVAAQRGVPGHRVLQGGAVEYARYRAVLPRPRFPISTGHDAKSRARPPGDQPQGPREGCWRRGRLPPCRPVRATSPAASRPGTDVAPEVSVTTPPHDSARPAPPEYAPTTGRRPMPSTPR